MSDSNGHCQDGVLTVNVQGGPHDGETIEIDLLLLRMTAQGLYSKHGMESIDGQMEATAGFLKDLTDGLKSLGYPCTPAIALHAWMAMGNYIAELEKKTSELPSSVTDTDSTSAASVESSS